jgi:hypothetical protein
MPVPTPIPTPTPTPPTPTPTSTSGTRFGGFKTGGTIANGGDGGCGCCEQSCNCGISCGECQIPRQDLSISWDNLISGPGSTTLYYQGSPTTQWISDCTNQLLYELVCTDNRVEFRVYYFLSGSCPTGQSQYCSTLRSDPSSLTVPTGGLQCAGPSTPFELTCDVTSASCPNLATSGYTSFTVTGPTFSQTPHVCATFCVGCGGTAGVSVVSVYTPDCKTLLASGTVTAGGSLCVNLMWSGSPGLYCVTATDPQFPTTTLMIDVECNQSYPVLLQCVVPNPLTLTDDAGTHDLVWEGSGSIIWWCCYEFDGSTIIYRVTLTGDSGICIFTIVRSWGYTITFTPTVPVYQVPAYCSDTLTGCPSTSPLTCNYGASDEYGFNPGEGIHNGSCFPITCDLNLGSVFIQNPPSPTMPYDFFGPLGPSVVIDS